MAQNVLTKTKNWNCETGVTSGQEFGENVTFLFQEVEALSGLEPSYKRATGYEFGPGIGEATDWGKEKYLVQNLAHLENYTKTFINI